MEQVETKTPSNENEIVERKWIKRKVTINIETQEMKIEPKPFTKYQSSYK